MVKTVRSKYPVPSIKIFSEMLMQELKTMHYTEVVMMNHLMHTLKLLKAVRDKQPDDIGTELDYTRRAGVLECRTMDQRFTATYQVSVEYNPDCSEHPERAQFEVVTLVTITDTSTEKETLTYRSKSHSFHLGGSMNSVYGSPMQTTAADIERWICVYLMSIRHSIDRAVKHPTAQTLVTQQAGLQVSHPYSL